MTPKKPRGFGVFERRLHFFASVSGGHEVGHEVAKFVAAQIGNSPIIEIIRGHMDEIVVLVSIRLRDIAIFPSAQRAGTGINPRHLQFERTATQFCQFVTVSKETP